MDSVSLSFPMHLDERSGSLRGHFANMLRPNRSRRRYHVGLNHITLSAKSGDRIGLVGRNGAGKTTLLRTLAGVFEPDTGHIRRVGKTVSLINLSMGMDVYATGTENVYRRAALFGVNGEASDRLLENVKEFSELGRFMDEPIRTYSSGMQARLSFAIATAIEAQIILMDEWISAGDKRFIEAAERRMETFFSEDRILFLASHSASLVRQWCNRLIVLDQGRIIIDTSEVNSGIAEFHKMLEEDDGSR